jgi:hypothetical protein
VDWRERTRGGNAKRPFDPAFQFSLLWQWWYFDRLNQSRHRKSSPIFSFYSTALPEFRGRFTEWFRAVFDQVRLCIDVPKLAPGGASRF